MNHTEIKLFEAFLWGGSSSDRYFSTNVGFWILLGATRIATEEEGKRDEEIEIEAEMDREGERDWEVSPRTESPIKLISLGAGHMRASASGKPGMETAVREAACPGTHWLYIARTVESCHLISSFYFASECIMGENCLFSLTFFKWRVTSGRDIALEINTLQRKKKSGKWTLVYNLLHYS